MGLFQHKPANFIIDLKNETSNIISEIVKIQEKFQIESSKKNGFIFNKEIKIHFSSFINKNFTISDGINQILSKALQILAKKGKISQHDENIFFVEFNLLNDLNTGLYDIFRDYFSIFKNKLYKNEDVYTILTFLSIFIIFVQILSTIPIINFINKYKTKIISIFLEIPLKNIREICLLIENFAKDLQNEDGEVSVKSDINYISDEMDFFKKKKKFKNNLKIKYGLLLIFPIIFLLFSSIFAMSFYFSNEFKNGINSINPEINSTFLFQSHFSYTENIQRFKNC